MCMIEEEVIECEHVVIEEGLIESAHVFQTTARLVCAICLLHRLVYAVVF